MRCDTDALPGALPGADVLRREFDVLMARAGIVVPPERYDGTLAHHIELRRLVRLLHRPRPAEAEPSNVFSLTVVTRGLGGGDAG